MFKLKREINDSRLRFLLGSISDKERIELAMDGVNVVIHTAAIKNIEISEFNPIQAIDTNINGTVNLLQSALKKSPIKFLNISTDKATNPSTLYGGTKLMAEKLTSWAGSHSNETKFASVRLGNVFETRGNVFEIWREELKNNFPLSITDPKMNRYFFHVYEAVDFVLKCLTIMKKGEVFVPKMKSYNIKNLADKISKKQKIIGIRQGEKLVELLISESEKENATEKSDMWVIKNY